MTAPCVLRWSHGDVWPRMWRLLLALLAVAARARAATIEVAALADLHNKALGANTFVISRTLELGSGDELLVRGDAQKTGPPSALARLPFCFSSFWSAFFMVDARAGAPWRGDG